jgi:chorismatase
MNESASLACAYYDTDDLHPNDNTLAVVAFGDGDEGLAIRGAVPYVQVTPIGIGFKPFYETWTTAERKGSGRRGPLVFAYDDNHLFCAGHVLHTPTYAERIHEAYSAAFALADEFGFPELNECNEDGLEIYQDFCRGRANAFEAFRKRMPSATGVGSKGNGITFYFLSSRQSKSVHLENPRQIPAYHYPVKYGPKSPTFARATLIPSPVGSLRPCSLYVSGTASILGHESVHEGSVAQQSDVALDNIANLIGDSNLRRYGYKSGFHLRDIRLAKVYVRHAEDLAVVADKCRAAFSPSTDIRFMNLDICRRELLVEIEVIA